MIFKKSGPKDIRTTIAKFETELAAANSLLKELDPKIADARIAIEEGAPGAAEMLAKLHTQRSKVAQDIMDLEMALRKVKDKLTEAIADEQRSAITKRWDECAAMVKERAQLAAEITAETAAVVKKLDRFKESGRKLYELAPAKDLMLNDSHLGTTAIDNHFKFLLLSLGLDWATYWAWGDATIPKFTEHAKEAHGWILKGATQWLKPINIESRQSLETIGLEFTPSEKGMQ